MAWYYKLMYTMSGISGAAMSGISGAALFLGFHAVQFLIAYPKTGGESMSGSCVC